MLSDTTIHAKSVHCFWSRSVIQLITLHSKKRGEFPYICT